MLHRHRYPGKAWNSQDPAKASKPAWNEIMISALTSVISCTNIFDLYFNTKHTSYPGEVIALIGSRHVFNLIIAFSFNYHEDRDGLFLVWLVGFTLFFILFWVLFSHYGPLIKITYFSQTRYRALDVNKYFNI